MSLDLMFSYEHWVFNFVPLSIIGLYVFARVLQIFHFFSWLFLCLHSNQRVCNCLLFLASFALSTLFYFFDILLHIFWKYVIFLGLYPNFSSDAYILLIVSLFGFEFCFFSKLMRMPRIRGILRSQMDLLRKL